MFSFEHRLLLWNQTRSGFLLVGGSTGKGELGEELPSVGVEWFVSGVGQTLIIMGTFSEFKVFLSTPSIHRGQ